MAEKVAVNSVKYATLRAAYVKALGNYQVPAIELALKNAGMTPLDAAKVQILAAYEKWVVETEDGVKTVLDETTFANLVGTEADRLQALANEIIRKYESEVAPFHAALKEIYERCAVELETISEKIVPPELDAFEARVTRAGGGGGGGAKTPRDWSDKEWVKDSGPAKGWKLKAENGDGNAEPTLFSLYRPNGEKVGEYPTPTEAARTAEIEVGNSGKVNGPRWWNIARAKTEVDTTVPEEVTAK